MCTMHVSLSLQVVLPGGGVRRGIYSTAAVMSDDIIHVVSFGGYTASTLLAATAVIEIGESLLMFSYY